MGRINLIKEDTDLSAIGNPVGWDLEVDGMPYDVYRVEGFVHTWGGSRGENCYWACPAGERPTFLNLIEFNGKAPAWGISFEYVNYEKSKWDETRIEFNGRCWITRNGKKFYNIPARYLDYGLAKAQYLLVTMLEECPLDVSFRGWEEKARGMKIWWREQPAIVRYVNPENKELWIVPDKIERFLAPKSWGNSDYEDYEDGLYVDMLSKEIGWLRE